jgi:hypothetical protein
MKDSNDIANLYKTLGQNPNQYQEVVRDEELAQANERWPLIAAMHDSDFSPPPVDQKKRGPRERAPVVTLEHENELEVGAHDYHARVETANAMALLADPTLTPAWAPGAHDVAEVVSPEPAQDLIETGWIAPERTAAQIELAAQAAQAAKAAHDAQLVKEAQAAKEAQAQRDAEAAQEEQAELAAEAAKGAKEADAVQAAKDAQAAKEALIVKAAQVARDSQVAAAKPVTQAPKASQVVPSAAVVAVTNTLTSDVQVIKKAVAALSTSIFQDDTKVAFAGAPASIFSESTLAESLMDEAASEYDDLGAELDAFIEEEIAPVVAKPKRERVVAEQVAPPKAVAAAPSPRVVEKQMPTTAAEPVSVVTLTHMRIRATGAPQPLAALFNRLSGSVPAASGVAEGKKSLLFERMKRT